MLPTDEKTWDLKRSLSRWDLCLNFEPLQQKMFKTLTLWRPIKLGLETCLLRHPMIFYLSPLFIIMYLLNFKKENMMFKFYIYLTFFTWKTSLILWHSKQMGMLCLMKYYDCRTQTAQRNIHVTSFWGILELFCKMLQICIWCIAEESKHICMKTLSSCSVDDNVWYCQNF